MRTASRTGTALCVFALALLAQGNAPAKELDSRGWKFTGDNAKQLPKVFDGRIETSWTSATHQKTG
ncbi:MAG: hypothetical protein QF886_07655, partial [Planctomycetota bacterium]|nr:hypothetical protein [Planctomycetota bacterium]